MVFWQVWKWARGSLAAATHCHPNWHTFAEPFRTRFRREVSMEWERNVKSYFVRFSSPVRPIQEDHLALRHHISYTIYSSEFKFACKRARDHDTLQSKWFARCLSSRPMCTLPVWTHQSQLRCTRIALTPSSCRLRLPRLRSHFILHHFFSCFWRGELIYCVLIQLREVLDGRPHSFPLNRNGSNVCFLCEKSIL